MVNNEKGFDGKIIWDVIFGISRVVLLWGKLSREVYWEFFTGPKQRNYTRESAEISYFAGSCSLL